MEKNENYTTNTQSTEESNGKFSFETQSAKLNAWRNDPKIRMFLFNSYLKNVNKYFIINSYMSSFIEHFSLKIRSHIIR